MAFSRRFLFLRLNSCHKLRLSSARDGEPRCAQASRKYFPTKREEEGKIKIYANEKRIENYYDEAKIRHRNMHCRLSWDIFFREVGGGRRW